MLQENVEPVSNSLFYGAESPAAGRWVDSALRNPLASLQFALSNVREIAKGHGLWNGLRERAGLSVQIEEQNEMAWLRLSGELDDASASLIEEGLAVAQYNHDYVVIDLDDLEFMDSSGIEAFLHAQERARSNGGRISIVNVHKHHKLFMICDALSLLVADR